MYKVCIDILQYKKISWYTYTNNVSSLRSSYLTFSQSFLSVSV